MNKKIILSLAFTCSIGLFSHAQNNVGIGTTTPDASAVLDIASTNMGLLVPRIALTITTSAAPVTAPATSLLVYNTATVNDVTPGYYFWDGAAWVTMGGGGSGGGTLDDAYDFGGAGAGRIITADAGEVDITASTASSIALRATQSNTGVAIIGNGTNTATTFSAIQASTVSNSTAASAVVGNTDGAAWGVSGQASAISTASAGVYGSNFRTTGGFGVLGQGYNGIVGQTDYRDGFGVYGQNTDNLGPLTANAVGTYGIGYVGVWGDTYGTGGPAVYANGELAASGLKTFMIDHPLDPENKYLKHFSIESNEALNVYRGNASFNNNGEVTISLPHYFDDINISHSYQLTPIGGYAPLYIKEKIADGKFVIAGGTSGMEVSWAVFAQRNDPYVQQNPDKLEVEPNKEDWNKGKYLQPSLFGQPDDKKIVKPLKIDKQKTLNIKK